MLIPKKSLGQNFLIDKNICRKILSQTEIKNKKILEIGPGTGLLTDEIIKLKPTEIQLIEKDENLFKLLKNKYKNIKNINILNLDILKVDLKKIDSKIIISNLPYNISTKIIYKLLKLDNLYEEIILMVQKEVADKMNYNKNIKNNKFNFFIQATCKFNIKFNVPKNVFFPKPKIESTVISIKPKLINLDKDKLEIFSKIIFTHKRKKISNIIKINNLNARSNKLLKERAEDLSTKDLLFLFNKF